MSIFSLRSSSILRSLVHRSAVRRKQPFSRLDSLLFPGLIALSTAFAAPASGLAAPGIVLQASLDNAIFGNGANGSNIETMSGLTAAGNGLFYGTTSLGGVYGRGTIFAFDPSLGSIALKASFDGLAGQVPLSRPILAANGNFYGTAYGGGAQNLGSIYQFDPTSGAIALLASFDGTNGSNPGYPLSLASNGRYYGTANGGIGVGAIFEYDPVSGQLALKASLNGTNGSNPSSGLTPAGNGRFYGTTSNGGVKNAGAIFEFDPLTGSITLKASFDPAANSSNPNAPLVSSGNGTYYGVTHGVVSDGKIFEFDPSSGSIAIKASFDSSTGCNLNSGLTPGGNGLFYGTAVQCGANNLGTLYEFNPALGTIAVIDSFDGYDGAHPVGELTAAGQGRFYGTASRGGDTFSGSSPFSGPTGRGAIFGFTAGTAAAPSPLPLIGAGAALGWSRQLRRQIHRSRPRPSIKA